ncbi:hypothetical protein GE09DRAFT_196525, partial [Coniochaeta sp. 2T2.1]
AAQESSATRYSCVSAPTSTFANSGISFGHVLFWPVGSTNIISDVSKIPAYVLNVFRSPSSLVSQGFPFISAIDSRRGQGLKEKDLEVQLLLFDICFAHHIVCLLEDAQCHESSWSYSSSRNSSEWPLLARTRPPRHMLWTSEATRPWTDRLRHSSSPCWLFVAVMACLKLARDLLLGIGSGLSGLRRLTHLARYWRSNWGTCEQRASPRALSKPPCWPGTESYAPMDKSAADIASPLKCTFDWPNQNTRFITKGDIGSLNITNWIKEALPRATTG